MGLKGKMSMKSLRSMKSVKELKNMKSKQGMKGKESMTDRESLDDKQNIEMDLMNEPRPWEYAGSFAGTSSSQSADADASEDQSNDTSGPYPGTSWTPPALRGASTATTTSPTSPLSQMVSADDVSEADPDDAGMRVTKPAPPPRLTRLSSLIDPEDLAPGAMVRSPSGHLLGAQEFIDHPDRPLSMRERQERIKASLSAPMGGAEEEAGGKKKRGWLCCC